MQVLQAYIEQEQGKLRDVVVVALQEGHRCTTYPCKACSRMSPSGGGAECKSKVQRLQPSVASATWDIDARWTSEEVSRGLDKLKEITIWTTIKAMATTRAYGFYLGMLLT